MLTSHQSVKTLLDISRLSVSGNLIHKPRMESFSFVCYFNTDSFNLSYVCASLLVTNHGEVDIISVSVQ